MSNDKKGWWHRAACSLDELRDAAAAEGKTLAEFRVWMRVQAVGTTGKLAAHLEADLVTLEAVTA